MVAAKLNSRIASSSDIMGSSWTIDKGFLLTDSLLNQEKCPGLLTTDRKLNIYIETDFTYISNIYSQIYLWY